MQAAQAAECANEQGKFWAYHAILFANQNGENAGSYNPIYLKNFAAAIDLDTGAFNSCLDKETYLNVVQSNNAEARTRGVNSTPTIFINGEIVTNAAASFQSLDAAVQAALQK